MRNKFLITLAAIIAAKCTYAIKTNDLIGKTFVLTNQFTSSTSSENEFKYTFTLGEPKPLGTQKIWESTTKGLEKGQKIECKVTVSFFESTNTLTLVFNKPETTLGLRLLTDSDHFINEFTGEGIVFVPETGPLVQPAGDIFFPRECFHTGNLLRLTLIAQ